MCGGGKRKEKMSWLLEKKNEIREVEQRGQGGENGRIMRKKE